MIELSSNDRKLISALKNNSRASVTTLAGLLGLSRATVQARLDRLISNGVIQRFTIEVSPQAEFETIQAITMIEIQGGNSRSIIRSLRTIAEIVELHSTNGAWDFVARIQTSSLPEFDQVLRQIREVKGVLNSETSLLLDSV
ncbi:MAG: Lrp/AsnC family transcriptional regulator [Pseudomonadota bacterium]